MLVTDAIRAAGEPDGESELGGARVVVRGGTARLPDGTLAGSVLTMDAAVRNAVGAGVPLEVASGLASLNPARYLGLDGKGRLEPGADADVVLMDGALEVREVIVAGRTVWGG
jgi:N-acetylglucosamine-6-phosphate deacetylase